MHLSKMDVYVVFSNLGSAFVLVDGIFIVAALGRNDS